MVWAILLYCWRGHEPSKRCTGERQSQGLSIAERLAAVSAPTSLGCTTRRRPRRAAVRPFPRRAMAGVRPVQPHPHVEELMRFEAAVRSFIKAHHVWSNWPIRPHSDRVTRVVGDQHTSADGGSLMRKPRRTEARSLFVPSTTRCSRGRIFGNGSLPAPGP